MGSINNLHCHMRGHDPKVTIRNDLAEVIERAWYRLGQPGTWWTGPDRIAIASEARGAQTCTLCKKRKTSIVRSVTEGTHPAKGELPSVAVDAAHRIMTDASRLTEQDYLDFLGRGLTDARYVEIVGIVTTIAGIDSFYRSLGMPLRPLPDPVPGNPSLKRPSGAHQDGAWVPTVRRQDLDPEDFDLYPNDRDGFVIRAMSLVPNEVRSMIEQSQSFYIQDLSDLATGRNLSRPQVELIAARVSALNKCFY